MPTLFMTGASGFVGRHFLAKYADKFDEIILPLRKDPIENYSKNIIVKKVHGQPSEIADLLTEFPCDYVLNGAAYGVSPGARNPQDMVAVNTALPIALAKSAQTAGAKKLVQLGSMSEYLPSDTYQPTLESDPLVQSSEGYAGSKAEASRRLEALVNSGNLQIICLRLFGIFGPGEGPHRLLVSLYDTLSNGRVAPMSAGTQVRDFIYVHDVIDAIYLALTQPTELKFKALNVGSGRGISVGDFAKLFCEIAGYSEDKLDLGALPMRDTDVAYMVAEIGASKRALGWTPKWDVETALGDYCDYLSTRSD